MLLLRQTWLLGSRQRDDGLWFGVRFPIVGTCVNCVGDDMLCQRFDFSPGWGSFRSNTVILLLTICSF